MKIIKLWNTVKSILKGKFIALGAYIKNGEISHQQLNATPECSRTTTRNSTQKEQMARNNKNSGLKPTKQKQTTEQK